MGNVQPKGYTRVFVAGLDGAGKTAILQRIVTGNATDPAPTMGWNALIYKFGKSRFTFWDIGGSIAMRPLWRNQFRGTQAVIFVVDSLNVDRMHEAAAEVHAMMADAQLTNAILMVMANKSEVLGAMQATEVAHCLNVEALCRGGVRPVRVQAVSAVTGEGLRESMEWLAEQFPGR